MRNELLGIVGLASAMVLASVAIGGCSSSDSSGGSGGSSGSGGTVGTGGSSNSAGMGGSSNTGGGAGMDGGGSSVTTVSGSKALNALTAAEVTQLCNDTYAYFGRAILKATTCKWKGLSFAASSSAPSQAVLQQNCTTQQSACQQGGDPWASNPGCNAIPSTCAATVAQYSACISDEIAGFGQTVDGLPVCTALMSSSTAAIFDAQTGGTPPASCASLTNACPELTPPSPLNQ